MCETYNSLITYSPLLELGLFSRAGSITTNFKKKNYDTYNELDT